MFDFVYIDPNADQAEIASLVKPGVNFSFGYPLEGSKCGTTHPPDHELKEVDFDKIFTGYASTINNLYSKTDEQLEALHDELQLDEDDDDPNINCCIVEPIIRQLLDTIRESYCPHYPIDRLQATSACLIRIDDFMAGKTDGKKQELMGMDMEDIVNRVFDENKMVGKMWKEKDANHMKSSIVDMYRRRKYPNLEWYYFRDLISEVWFEDGDWDDVDSDEEDPGYYKEGDGEGDGEEEDGEEEDVRNEDDDDDDNDEEEEEDEDEEEEEEDEEEDYEEDDDREDEQYHKDEPPRKRVRH